MKRPRQGTHAAIILESLELNSPSWITLSFLMREACCGSVHSVIATLRTKYGFAIENKLSPGENGRRLSAYRLLETVSEESEAA